MKPNAEITIPEVVADFAAYFLKPDNGAWGSMHIVLEDNNLRDAHVDFCIKYADEAGDTEGARLARLLRRMSRTQRSRLPRKVQEYIRVVGGSFIRPEFGATAEAEPQSPVQYYRIYRESK